MMWSALDCGTLGGKRLCAFVDSAKAAIDTIDFSYVGGNRYVQLVPVFSGTHGVGTQMYAQAVRGNPHVAPVS